MKKIFLFSVLFLLLNGLIKGQGSAGSAAAIELPYLIDMPTAGVLEKGKVGVGFYLMPDGVFITRIDAGVFESFNIGISYGASNFIGTGTPGWFKLPGVSVKARIIDETASLPGFAIGFDSQGKGEFFSKYSDFNSRVDEDKDLDVNRFKTKSPGFYIAGSKNFEFLGFLSLHGILNYSLETGDRDKNVNLIVGFEKTLGKKLSIVGEYDFAINDNAAYSFGDGNGYLNAGVRWTIGDGFTAGLDLRDLLSNKKLKPGAADRAVKVEFIKPIF